MPGQGSSAGPIHSGPLFGEKENRFGAHDDPVPQLCGRKEKALQNVAKAGLAAGVRKDILLVDVRNDRAGDEIPLRVQGDWTTGLAVSVQRAPWSTVPMSA